MPQTLREWQIEAMAKAISRSDRFALEACPGAGKTFFSLTLFQRKHLKRLVVVVPTDNLREQWADVAYSEFGLDLDTEWGGELDPAFDGFVLTYQQLKSSSVSRIRQIVRDDCMVVLDECHRLSIGKEWGKQAQDSFKSAAFLLCVSGTPFRTDKTQLPFVEYDQDGYAIMDHRYKYKQALMDKTCAAVRFSKLRGYAKWIESDGQEVSAWSCDRMDEGMRSRQLRSLLDEDEQFVTDALDRGLELLASSRLRKGGEHSQGLVVCYRKEQAGEILRKLQRNGCKVGIATSENTKDARESIERFQKGLIDWLVTVDMVSEGSDFPNAKVLVYLSNKTAPRYVVQCWTRVARKGILGSIVIPEHPVLEKLASDFEKDVAYAIENTEDPSDPDDADKEGGKDKTPVERFSDWQVCETKSSEEEVIISGHGGFSAEHRELADYAETLGIVAPPLALIQLAQKAACTGNSIAKLAAVPQMPLRKRKKDLKARIAAIAGKVAYQKYGEIMEMSDCMKKIHTDWIEIAGHSPETEGDLKEKLDWLEAQYEG
jgi:superfamily II DNA or RNA helicase